MSQRNNKPRQPTKEERLRMVDDAMNILYGAKPLKKYTPEERILDSAKAAHIEVQKRYRLRLDLAPGLMFDRAAMTKELCDLYIEEFRKLDKESLLFVLSMLHVEIALENL